MSYHCLLRPIAVFLLALSLTSSPALAQVDLSGQWQHLNHSDARTHGPGPDLADYTQIPLNDEGRAVALSYSYSLISIPERVCMHFSENLITDDGPSIQIERVDDPVNGGVIAWQISAGGSDRSPVPIWMDGRGSPSANDLHTFAGFTTGGWEGGVLTARMTHMKGGTTQRNGAPLSDQATMTIHLIRHADLLTILTITEDPIYLDVPFVHSGTYQLNLVGNVTAVNQPCYPMTEVPRFDVPGTIPHYLPATNPFVNEFAASHNLPLETALGGADHIYPEYRKKLKDAYKIPPTCKLERTNLLNCNPVR